ncbi:hypothetical protein TRFO_23267 [Tritrichomonas foetus]|uniref:Ubiquitin-like domain-containing protein n=1 Tax=Tritrichomonas foetus TaxID=1144522 RepID=A0A1J4KBB5_9EUKA|nr:hypothetical protein TRFO_23267 [Tritrichomonas foetus]|eukprot:OHT08258.1 hypothetical protein TRFO_23267 [Tritrichomonas foetus]
MIDVNFSIISGKRQVLRIKPETTVQEAKQTLSFIVDSPPHTITLLHKARVLHDNEKFGELDFTSRNFVAVGIKKKPVVLMKSKPIIESNQISPLKNLFGDSFASVRQHFLENPTSVPILIAFIAQTDPANARLLTENPQILLRFLGIAPDEFLSAINNMTQRNQISQELQLNELNTSQQQGANSESIANQNDQPNQEGANLNSNQPQENLDLDQQQSQQRENVALSISNTAIYTYSNEANENNDNIQPNMHSNSADRSTQSLNSINDQNISFSHEVNDQNVSIESTTHQDSENGDISQFLATMTQEDLNNLETVLATNVPLEEVIPVFLRMGKNVEATITALRQRQ